MVNAANNRDSEVALKFRKPPVVETVLSVQFKPLPGIGAGHLGVFWHQLGGAWPNVADAPALEREFERFASDNIWEAGGLRFKLQSQVDARLQIQNATRDRMIQVQNGRFLFNWTGSGQSYPSYESVRPEFDEYWDRFREFLSCQSTASLELDQWEVVYVNHIPKGDLWTSPNEIPRVLSFLGSTCLDPGSTEFEYATGEWRYEIPSQRGRLYVRLGKTQKDGIPNIVLTLTARGPIGKKKDGISLDEGLELGHQVIQKSFLRLTSEEAQRHWEPMHASTSK